MEHEAIYRLAVFSTIFLVMAGLELLIPKRHLSSSKFKRWITNISFGGLNAFVVRLMLVSAVPLVAISAALLGEELGFGLLRLVEWPGFVEILASLFILDLAIYLQHLASHKVPLLWRVHRVHHADRDIDVTTAVRFHPIEIGLSMLYKTALVLLLGVDALAVLLFEMILNGCAMFNHSNIALPAWLDRIVRQILVTPDMHRVHHSVIRGETDSNYGFNLSIWDRLFGTYIDQPSKGHKGMVIGLPPYEASPGPTKFSWSLALPFIGERDEKGGRE